MIATDQWKPADGLTLEPNALRAATETIRSLALTAGPGAGKTEMLAQRADFLFRTGTCCYPRRILAISFKVDASKNLKERVARRCGRDFGARFDSYTFHSFAKRIIDRFRPILMGDQSLDVGYSIVERKNGPSRQEIEFNDLVPFAIEILTHSEVARNAIRQTYSDVFLDEFQDCTNLQYELLKIAFQGTNVRLTAVGDTKQKIMSWAGALEGIFESFANDFNAVALNMYRNFRSKPVLLRLQNEIIRDLDPASVMPVEQLEGEEGEVLAWKFKDSKHEAGYLADCIFKWVHDEKIPHSEIAVLVSKQLSLYASDLMEELDNRGIAYRNEQEMQDLSSEPLARLIVDYLLCIYGEREPKAWVRLTEQLIPFADDEIQARGRHNLNSLIQEQRKNVVFDSLSDESLSSWWSCIVTLIEHIGTEVLASLHADYEVQSRIKKVITDTKDRIEELLQQEPDLLKALARFSDDQSVRILTIHKSKGLEFDSVIMMAVEKEIFFGKPDEELCAFFVGVSRAKKRLMLTHANHRDRPQNHQGYWRENRTPQSAYFAYALPFCKQS